MKLDDKPKDLKSRQEIISFLTEKTGLPFFYTLEFDKLEDLYERKETRYGKYKNYKKYHDIKVIDKEDNEHPFSLNQLRFDFRGIVAKKFIVTIYRSIKDFGWKIETIGKYKNCEGGGWYTIEDIYRLEGTDMKFISSPFL